MTSLACPSVNNRLEFRKNLTWRHHSNQSSHRFNFFTPSMYPKGVSVCVCVCVHAFVFILCVPLILPHANEGKKRVCWLYSHLLWIMTRWWIRRRCWRMWWWRRSDRCTVCQGHRVSGSLQTFRFEFRRFVSSVFFCVLIEIVLSLRAPQSISHPGELTTLLKTFYRVHNRLCCLLQIDIKSILYVVYFSPLKGRHYIQNVKYIYLKIRRSQFFQSI